MRLLPFLSMLVLLPAVAPAAGLQVVELYQSQGCSSCPPANAVLAQIADRPDVIALNFSVTYWDRLGWKDSFAQPAFTRRQWDYAHAAGRENVATPQMIINGRAAVVGSNRAEVEAAIRAYARTGAEPVIAAANGSVTIGSTAAQPPSTVWLVRYDPRSIDVPVRAGENGGKTLPHREIVRDLIALGTWHGASAHFAVPPKRDSALRSVIIVQRGIGGPIVAANRID
jgi:hypothetical protein